MKVIKHLEDKNTEKEALECISRSLAEVRLILDTVPSDISIYFDNFCLMKEFGVGGFAYSNDIITIAFDVLYEDKNKQLEYLRQTVFHEAYHLAHGYHAQKPVFLPIEEAIYEGAATAFERDYVDSPVPYGLYDKKNIALWLSEIKSLKKDYDRQKWKFYNKERDERWMLYKVGTYVVDEAVSKSGKTIVDLNKCSAKEILEMSEL